MTTTVSCLLQVAEWSPSRHYAWVGVLKSPSLCLQLVGRHHHAVETYRSLSEVARRHSVGWEIEMSRSLLLQGTADVWLDVFHAAICSRDQAFSEFQAAN
jgi:hypothetical protein